MDYENTKRFMMRTYPGLFPYEEDVLDHLFFVIGNGYRWEGGELVDKLDPSQHSEEEAIASAKELMRKFHRDEIKYSHSKKMRSYHKEMLREIDDPNYEEIERQRSLKRRERESEECALLPDGRRVAKIYPVCEYSKIVTVPNNVTPSWLNAAKKALEIAPLMEPTEETLQWLETAKKRLKEMGLL